MERTAYYRDAQRLCLLDLLRKALELVLRTDNMGNLPAICEANRSTPAAVTLFESSAATNPPEAEISFTSFSRFLGKDTSKRNTCRKQITGK
jgi:hypothetical protein